MAYGAWVDKKGNLIIVEGEECHVEVAIDEILKRPTKVFSTYRTMFRLGYTRLIFSGSRVTIVEFPKNPTRQQREYSKDADIINNHHVNPYELYDFRIKLPRHKIS